MKERQSYSDWFVPLGIFSMILYKCNNVNNRFMIPILILIKIELFQTIYDWNQNVSKAVQFSIRMSNGRVLEWLHIDFRLWTNTIVNYYPNAENPFTLGNKISGLGFYYLQDIEINSINLNSNALFPSTTIHYLPKKQFRAITVGNSNKL